MHTVYPNGTFENQIKYFHFQNDLIKEKFLCGQGDFKGVPGISNRSIIGGKISRRIIKSNWVRNLRQRQLLYDPGSVSLETLQEIFSYYAIAVNN